MINEKELKEYNEFLKELGEALHSREMFTRQDLLNILDMVLGKHKENKEIILKLFVIRTIEKNMEG